MKRRRQGRRVLFILLVGAALESVASGADAVWSGFAGADRSLSHNTMPPYDGAFPFPTVLSATGAFSDVPNVVPPKD